MENTNIYQIHAPFSPQGDQPNAIGSLVSGFQQGKQFQTLLGVTGSGKTFTMAHVIAQMEKKTLVLAPNKTLAAQLYEELKEFFPNNAVEYFISYYDYYQPEAYVPGTDTYIEKDSAINEEIDKLRHRATRSLLENDHVIVVASVSCIYGIGSPEQYEGQKLVIFQGDQLSMDQLKEELVQRQYIHDAIDFSRGKFRQRGEIIEVFLPHEDEHVARIEFFDGEIDQILLVDPLRGDIIEELKRVVIYPTSHYVVAKERIEQAMKGIKLELRERLQELRLENKLLEERRLSQRTLHDLEMLDEMGFCSGIENYTRHINGTKPGEPPPTLIDYFGNDYLLIIDESHITVPQVAGMFKGDYSRKKTLVDYGFRLPSALDNRPLNFTEFEQRYSAVLFVSATPAQYELEKTQGEVVEQIIRPTGLLDPRLEVRKASNQVEDFFHTASEVIERGSRVLVTTLTKKLSEQLTDYYKRMGLRVRYLHSDIDSIERIEILRDLRLGEFDILVGINLLREGLDLPEVELVGIMDADREGFLRSTRSLIQTIGRAARNDQGKVIMYAHQMTKSMNEAIRITEDRRKRQQQYNQEHNITPATVKKSVKGGVIETLRGKKGMKKTTDAAIDEKRYKSIEELEKDIAKLNQQMRDFSKNLEFEKAVRIRDQVKKLNKIRIMF